MTQPNAVVTRRDQLAVSGPVFREFTAKLANMEFPIENQRAKAKLQFTEMKVFETVAPYPHPTGEITLNRTGNNGARPSDRSPWGRLLISADEQGFPDLLELMGHVLHIKAHEQKIEANPERGQEAGSFLTWEILAVDGTDRRPQPEDASNPAPAEPDPKASGATNGPVSEDDLLTLIDGKTIGEFTSSAIQLPMPAQLRARLLDANDLIPGWITSGKVTTDGNTYTKV